MYLLPTFNTASTPLKKLLIQRSVRRDVGPKHPVASFFMMYVDVNNDARAASANMVLFQHETFRKEEIRCCVLRQTK
jgi:hypothetical protein